VVDRRKFTADGDPLDQPSADAPSARAETPSESPAVETPPPDPRPSDAPPPKMKKGQPSQNFLELVTMLASQAELLMIGAEDFPAQPAEAQRMIDYLGVLEEKTAGNLSDDETKILSTVLYQLRTSFLQRK
jgi:hypothetical protein